MSSDKRRWFRSKPRSLGTAVGKILLDSKSAPIDCTVVDISAGGACLEFSRPPQVPDTLEFLHGGVKKIAKVAWRRGYRIGISFSASIERSVSSSGLARPSSLRR